MEYTPPWRLDCVPATRPGICLCAPQISFAEVPSAAGAGTAASDSSDATSPAETVQEAAEQGQGDEEGRAIGHVKWQVYTAYATAVGTGLVLLVLLSLALMQVSLL